jgi:phi LC3 family holin
MKGLKTRMHNYGFWMSMASALVLCAQALAPLFGFHLIDGFDLKVSTAVTAVLGVLTVLGVVSNPKEGKLYADAPVEEEQK